MLLIYSTQAACSQLGMATFCNDLNERPKYCQVEKKNQYHHSPGVGLLPDTCYKLIKTTRISASNIIGRSLHR